MTERDAFERWAFEHYAEVIRDDEGYAAAAVHHAWEGWQARDFDSTAFEASPGTIIHEAVAEAMIAGKEIALMFVTTLAGVCPSMGVADIVAALKQWLDEGSAPQPAGLSASGGLDVPGHVQRGIERRKHTEEIEGISYCFGRLTWGRDRRTGTDRRRA